MSYWGILYTVEVEDTYTYRLRLWNVRILTACSVSVLVKMWSSGFIRMMIITLSL